MSLIGHFITGIYEVTRPGQGTYQNGMYLSGQDETFTLEGSLQPSSAAELKIMEEGTRLKQYYVFYTDEPLLLINTKTLSGSDRVTIDGASYKVLSIEPWKGVSLPHYKSILTREPEQ